MINWDKVTSEDVLKIDKIVQRATSREGYHGDTLSLIMDITASHLDTPLDLDALLHAPSVDFCHDVYGIVNNINRKTGKLENCFLPRFARHQG